MRKKIIVCVFSLLIIITVIFSITGAITSYNYEMQNYPEDKWVGFGAAISIVAGGFLVFYELDLFYTVYYFFIKPKTLTKTILNVLSNLSLLLICFTNDISHFFYKYISEIFGEEFIIAISLFLVYLILRITYAIISFKVKDTNVL